LKVNVLPGDGGELFGCLGALRIPGVFLVLQEPGEDRGIVKDDAIGDQGPAGAFKQEPTVLNKSLCDKCLSG
jgi:hypothetical protein